MTLLPFEPWMEDAACMWADRDGLFFSDSGDPRITQQARAICRSCPVIEPCRDYADRYEPNPLDAWGIYAGETAKERQRRRRQAGRWAA